MSDCCQFKAQITLILQNDPQFTLKSEKVIWIRETQGTAEIPPLSLSLQATCGLMEINRSVHEERISIFQEVDTFCTGNTWPSEKLTLVCFKAGRIRLDPIFQNHYCTFRASGKK